MTILIFSFFIFPIVFIGIGARMLYSFIRIEKDFKALIGSLVLIALGSFLINFTRKRLFERNNFETVYLRKKLSLEQIADIIKDNFRLKDYNLNEDLGCITAYTKLSAFSWGEKLTIVQNRDSVLINSRPEGQPITIIKDKRNIEKLRRLFS